MDSDIPFIKMRGEERKRIRTSRLSDMERILEVRLETRLGMRAMPLLFVVLIIGSGSQKVRQVAPVFLTLSRVNEGVIKGLHLISSRI